MPARARKPRKRTQLSASARGYHYRHQKIRTGWAPLVNAGQVRCHAVLCLEERDGRSRWIVPGTPWHLGHTPDRTAWTGPEHARCNLSDGAVRGNRMRGQRGTVRRRKQSRTW